ncbi:nucleoside deaminase [Xanthobacter sp. 126]|uniref:nucleoside deaminase n=1 Tax=Xanthobacter sp. 126 TaxID=1131814 RepID=UPI001FD8B4C3|nr:nucleoside deaminase [Xanthobacter sp. 126]
MRTERQPAIAHAPSRRSVLASLAAAAGSVLSLFPSESRAEAVLGPPRPEDEELMREAIALAAQSDFPFGAVITRGGVILSRGPNLGRQLNDPTAHAEMVAIRRFLAARPADELKGATIYASAEPCPMCMGAILWCGIHRVVFGASLEQVAAKYGRQPQIGMPALDVARTMAEAAPFLKVEITGGVLAPEALALFDKN